MISSRDDSQKLVALIDFDGTLSKGYISMQFLDFLYNADSYSEYFYEKQMRLLKNYNEKMLSYSEWCELWGDTWADGLENIDCDSVDTLAEVFYDDFKKNIYQDSYKLVEFLKKDGYEVDMMSLGASEILDVAGRDLGFDNVFASRVGRKNGLFTGSMQTYVHKKHGKEKFVSERFTEPKYNLKNSVGIGDSGPDKEYIKLLGKRIALNPNKELSDYAQKNGWKIHFFEKDNIDDLYSHIKKVA